MPLTGTTAMNHKNRFKINCVECGALMDDETYLDADGGWFFFRTKFSCNPCKLSYLTRRTNFNTVKKAAREDWTEAWGSREVVMLELTVAVASLFLEDGIDRYPFGTVKMFRKGKKEYVLKSYPSTSVGNLHHLLLEIATEVFARQPKARQAALEVAYEYLESLTVDELKEIRGDEDSINAAAEVCTRLQKKMSDLHGISAAAKKQTAFHDP